MEKQAAQTVTMFGAALTTVMIAPELQGDIISLSFTPATNPYVTGGPNIHISINEIVDGGFSQWNTSGERTMSLDGGVITGISVIAFSQTLSPDTFFPSGAPQFSPSSSGTNYLGFRTSHDNVGWFSFSVAGPGTDIFYLEGAYGTEGESLHVGTIPAPGALALLALGAAGVRRGRKRVA